ncbi:PRD domain-containing protein [Paenibacillus sp. GSMTC-2017]|uniref:PRD domain-containing protein n=1 Tax=Paenibacillus sp. GSMTC-2017 TaxID=2794350 RepID=UPI0018D61EAD|nr:PRD domain-containing protein [Paenibacillus sp. GSMTC-2017]MBH5318915.1 PRD domain-containing protein [Paenibacillus sp. GSMTC-2017]
MAAIDRRIIHVLSNNVVMTKLSSGKNSIVFGKGIGFKKQPGMNVSEKEISQEFLLHTMETIEHYEQILNNVDTRIVGITEEVIAMAQQRLEGEFSETIHAALVDHINFAIERCRRGVLITNPFAYEIKMMYKDEYDVATEAVNYLNQKLDAQFPEDEISFLAMHFHGARNRERGTETLAVVRLVAKVMDEAKAIGLQFNDSFSSVRFISHLKGLIDRVRKESHIKNPLLQKIKIEYPQSYKYSLILSSILEEQLKKVVPDDEIGFLTLHIERLNQREGI